MKGLFELYNIANHFFHLSLTVSTQMRKNMPKSVKNFWVHFGRQFLEIGIVDSEFDLREGHTGPTGLTRQSNSRRKISSRSLGGSRPNWVPSKSFFVHRAAPPVATLPTLETSKRSHRDDAAQKISSRSVARSARYSTRKFDGFCGATWRPVNVFRPFLQQTSATTGRTYGPNLEKIHNAVSEKFDPEGFSKPAHACTTPVAKKFYQRSRLL